MVLVEFVLADRDLIAKLNWVEHLHFMRGLLGFVFVNLRIVEEIWEGCMNCDSSEEFFGGLH